MSHLMSNTQFANRSIPMKFYILILSFVLASNFGFTQTELDDEILNVVILSELEIENKGIYIQCGRFKTYFNSSEFLAQSSLKIPIEVLKELESSALQKEGTWDSLLTEKAFYKSENILSDKCLTRKEVIDLFKRTKIRQTVLSLSNPIFDDEKEHCVLSISYSKYIGSAHGHSLLLKKVSGNWIVLERFKFWMT